MVQTRIAPAGGVMLSLSHEKSTDTQQKETAEKEHVMRKMPSDQNQGSAPCLDHRHKPGLLKETSDLFLRAQMCANLSFSTRQSQVREESRLAKAEDPCIRVKDRALDSIYVYR